MNLLVTGGAGYIGSHMTRMLVKRGHRVVVLDTLEYGHREAVPPEAGLVVGNVGDADVVDRILSEQKTEAVLHFAGYLQVEESVRFPIKYIENNIVRPVTLLESMRKHGVTNIIFSSTAAVYGNPKTVPIPEDHQKEPVSPYGLSKWAFEELLRVYDRSYGIKSISLRYFNACGASLDGGHGEVHAPETHLIPLACLTGLGVRKEFSLFGTDYDTPDGTALRDFIHIEDLCEAHILALEALQSGHASDVYNVGTGNGVSVRSVVDAVRDVVGKDFPVKESERRPGDPAILVSDPSKLMNELGWKPRHSDISSIVRSAYEWHRSHPEGY